MRSSANKGLTDPFEIVSVSVIVELDLDGEPGGGAWEPGPAPFNTAAYNVDDTGVAERALRSTYFERVVQPALYGKTGTPRRWWRRPESSEWSHPAAAELEMLELHDLAEEARATPNVLLIAHMRVRGDPLPTLRSLVSLAAEQPDQERTARGYAALAGGAARPAADARRAFQVVYAEPRVGLASLVEEDATPEALDDPYDQWLFYLAAATDPRAYPLSSRGAAPRTGSVMLSNDWDALVLRDGASFLARRRRENERDFLNHAERYVRSIYLDSLLLGQLQRVKLRRFAADAADLGDPMARPSELVALEHRVLRFRNIYWWGHLSSHGIPNRLLGRYREQHRLPELSRQIFEDLSVYATHIQAQSTTRTEALVGLVAIVGLPFAILLEAVQAFDASFTWGLAATLTALVAIFVIGAFPAAQELLRPIVSDRLITVLDAPRRVSARARAGIPASVTGSTRHSPTGRRR